MSDAPVITGFGIVSPIGTGADAFWDALLNGRDGVQPVASFDAGRFRVQVGCEVPAGAELIDSDPTIGRATRLAATAGAEALTHAGLAAAERSTTAVCVGTTMGEAGWIESWAPAWAEQGVTLERGAELRRSAPDRIGADLAALLELGGSVAVVAGACAAGNFAIARAADLIRLGRAERVLAGGTDAFSRVAFTGFARLGALAADRCRPFSADRDGIVLGEGAAMVVVESAAAARARGARPIAELRGAGLSCDAGHIVAPDEHGAGLARAVRAALADAQAGPSDIDWICAHGTGTPANDRAEVRAARAVFGDAGAPMTSIKALTGHGLGAASAIEAVACLKALETQVIPPTWHHRESDPECEWDVVPNAPRAAALDTVINNAAAFGGVNASIVLSRA